MVEFEVLGEPKAKARPRVTKSGIAYTPKTTVKYENLVKQVYMITQRNKPFLEGEIKAEMDFYFSIPKSASKKKKVLMASGEIRPVKRPDVDNIIKSIADSLNGLAYNDDSQIVEIVARKWYAEQPKAVVKLTEIEKGEHNDMDKTIEKLIKEELERANKKFPLFASEHEGYAVMLEEFEEAQEEIEDIKSKLETLWHVTRNKNIEMGYRFFLVEHIKEITIRAIQELIQLAAMCDKYKISLKDKE